MNLQYPARRLRPFLAGSIVLHLTVLAVAPAALHDFHGLPDISVSLIPSLLADQGRSENPSPTGRGAGVREAPQRSQVTSSDVPSNPPLSVTDTSPDTIATFAPTVQSEPANAPEATAATTTAPFTAEIRGHIENELARFFHYPPLARREGWEGTVQLRFDVAADGAIRNIQVAASSGYALLDRAAQAALAKASHIPVWPAGETLTMELPVYYRLADAR